MAHPDAVALELDRHADVELLPGGDAYEVDVDEAARDRVPLDLTDHRPALFLGALELEQEDGVLAALAPEQLAARMLVHADRHRRLVAAVHHRRDPARPPQLPRRL